MRDVLREDVVCSVPSVCDTIGALPLGGHQIHAEDGPPPDRRWYSWWWWRPGPMPLKRTSMSAAESDGHPALPPPRPARPVVGVRPIAWDVEGDRQATTAGGPEAACTLVGLLGVAEAGELPDRQLRPR